jgi:ATP-binding cassette subfamily F protein uup
MRIHSRDCASAPHQGARHRPRRSRLGDVKIAIGEGQRSGKLVAELTGVSKEFSGRKVVKNLDLIVSRGDRLGFIGPNGAGKTMLLNLILGTLAPDSGTVRLGTNVQVAYFDQMREALDLEKTVAETISPGSEWVDLPSGRKHVMSYLGDFLFPPRRANSKISMLSGGERNRLLLARLFAKPANVLVLDEPTNDLDIESLELLEAALQDYAGTILLVSHDRAFLDNVVTQTLAFEGSGLWNEYAGGYSDYLRQRVVSAPLTRGGCERSARAGGFFSEAAHQAHQQRDARAGGAARRDRGAGSRAQSARRQDGRRRLLPPAAGRPARGPAPARRDRPPPPRETGALGGAGSAGTLAFAS